MQEIRGRFDIDVSTVEIRRKCRRREISGLFRRFPRHRAPSPYLLLRQNILGHPLKEPGAALFPHLPGLCADPAEELPLRAAVRPLDDSLNGGALLSEPHDAQRRATRRRSRVVTVALRSRGLDTALLADVLAAILAEVRARSQHHAEFLAAESTRADATSPAGASTAAAASLVRPGGRHDAHVPLHVLQPLDQPADPLLLRQIQSLGPLYHLRKYLQLNTGDRNRPTFDELERGGTII